MREIYGVKISNPRFQWFRTTYILRDAVTKRFLSDVETDQEYAKYFLTGLSIVTLLTLIIKYATILLV